MIISVHSECGDVVYTCEIVEIGS